MILYVAFAQALVATLGSLFFSEVMMLTPCKLCWYQRILMYPLTVILAVGILRKDKRVWQYVLPLSILGWITALYHVLLYYGVIAENLVPCAMGVSCTTRYIAWFGFLSIPLLSLVAFSVINICMYLWIKTKK